MRRIHWRSLLGPSALLAITLLAYLPAMRGGFIWDDNNYVTENTALRRTGGLARIWLDPGATPQYYPLTHTSFWIEYRLWGLGPTGYHVTNALLHGLSAILLGLVLGTLRVPGAWLAAGIFALHPAHVESVAWITERKNVLSGVFCLASALAYLRFALADETLSRKNQRLYVFAFFFFLCALLSKTVTATLPIALGIVLWWKRGRLRRQDVLTLAPMLVVGAALGTMTAWLERHHVGAEGQEWSLSIPERLLVAGRAFWFYLGKLAWPADLTFIYPRWQLDALGAPAWLFPLGVGAVLAGLWLLRRRLGPGPLVAVLYFVVTLSPALGFFDVYPMRYSFVADHFQYLASIGPIALFSAVCARGTEALGSAKTGAAVPFLRTLLYLVPAALLFVLGSLTARQGSIYRNPETLWRDTLAKNPSAWMAHNNLGTVLARDGRLDEAIAHFKEALELKPDHAGAHDNLGRVLAGQGRMEEAIEHFSRAVRLVPGEAGFRTNLADALAGADRTQEALVQFSRALKVNPRSADAHARLGAILARQGNGAEAMTHLEQALRLEPDHANAHYNLGTLFLRIGRKDEAIAHLAEAVRLEPDFEKARRNLAIARQGQALPDHGM